MSETYQNFKNYETYCVHQWLTNVDEGEYATAVSIVNDAATVDEGADALQEYVEDNNPLGTKSSDLYSDLLTAALEDVNWQELAEALWNEGEHVDELDDDEYDEEYHRTGDVGESEGDE